MLTDELLGDISAVLASITRVDPSDVTPDKTFGELGIDSLALVEAVIAIEDRFGALIPDDEWSRFSTVGDLAAHLQRSGVGAV